MAGKTAVPDRESIESFARHGATMVIFLSAGNIPELANALIRGGFASDTPAAVVYKASWSDEKILRGTVADIADMAEKSGIKKTALIVVGNVLGSDYELSKLYSADFSTEYRSAKTN